MMDKRLCLFPYYGGKAKMSQEIIELVEGCRGVHTYIEPFGGAASVLLNKAPHRVEIYNEQSPGMCALFRLLSDREKSKKLIRYISKNTNYSLKCFEECKDYRDYLEDNHWIYFKNRMKVLVNAVRRDGIVKGVKYKDISVGIEEIGIKGFNFKDAFLDKHGNFLQGLSKCQEDEIDYLDSIVKKMYKEYNKNRQSYSNVSLTVKWFNIDKLNKISSMTGLNKNQIINNKAFKNYAENFRKLAFSRDFEEYATNNRDEIDFEDMRLAASTYVIYKQSRNGMGDTFRGDMYSDNYAYQNEVAKLYDIAERLRGVKVEQWDAFNFFYDEFMKYKDEPSILIYADPTYLEQKPHVSKNSSLSVNNSLSIKDAIKLIKKEEKEYNPGNPYKLQWDRNDHENFLEQIQDAKCKMIVSNYRDKYRLYDKYLDKAHGWKSLEYDTKTTVGKTASDRTEVLWYNF